MSQLSSTFLSKSNGPPGRQAGVQAPDTDAYRNMKSGQNLKKIVRTSCMYKTLPQIQSNFSIKQIQSSRQMKVWMSLFSLKKSLWRYLTYRVRWRMLKSVVKCFQVYTVCLNRLIRIIIWKTSDFKLISPIRIWKWPFSSKNDWISSFFVLVWFKQGK